MAPCSSDSEEVLWRKIVEIHNATKAHLIYCEETGPEHKTFLQPRNELCNALEHIIRGKAHELGMSQVEAANGDYQKSNLDKVLGHEYRAFFDVCDWLTLTLRNRIRSTLEPYAKYPDVIIAVIPDYYKELRPKIEDAINKIAEIRTRKDIKGDVLAEVKQYNQIVSDLKRFSDELSSKVPGLEELKSAKLHMDALASAKAKEEKSEKKFEKSLDRKFTLLNLIFAGLFGGAVTACWRWLVP